MGKKRKQSKSKEKAAEPTESAVGDIRKAKERPMLRAIRVTAEVLDAAKAYKKATGTSFYAVGLGAITEVLKREGYLKAEESKA